MADANIPRWPPLSRELGRRPRPDDYAPGAPVRAASYQPSAIDTRETATPVEPEDDMLPERAVNLLKLQDQLLRKPLDEIATLVGGLTYGDMIHLAGAIWRTQPEGLPVTEENLPALLHRWSKAHSAGASIAEENRSSPSALSRESIPVETA